MSFFNIKGLRYLNLVNNRIVSLLNNNVNDAEQFSDSNDATSFDEVEDITWQCHSLKSLNLSGNQLKFIPSAIHAANSLEKLLLRGNQISSFPTGWKCPLRILDLSKNELTDFRQSVFNAWTETMVDLNLSSNKFSSISWDICQLKLLQYLDLSKNCIENMPPKHYWTCTNLRKLNLSENKLCGVSTRTTTTSPTGNLRRLTFMSRPPTVDRDEIEDEFPYEVFGSTLETLDLSDNKLAVVPKSVCQLTSLEDLNLSRNRPLRSLPPDLGNLTECYQLGIEGLNLSGIPRYARSGHTSKDVLTYLRAKQRKSVPYYRMKLMVIGLQGRGKTTLLAALRNQPRPPNISTVGIVVNQWTVSGFQTLRERMVQIGRRDQVNPSITFSTWDLAGQEIYYSTHQCFLSSNTLYLAVWNISTGEEGIDKLKPWLLNVQARAPGSHVIIVGTHLDLLPGAGKYRRVDELRLNIAKRYNKKGFPLIKGYYMVSCTSGENLDELRQAIYQAALELKETESTGKGDTLIGRKIPISYLKLQETVMKEAENRMKENKPPILNEYEMLELAKKDPNNDILERDELILAARFLHENGVILHYNDRSRGLDKLYFIEPGWLCKIMAFLVTVKETNAFVKGGIMEKSNVNLLLKDPRLPPEFMEQYIQLMERFEVALALDDHRLLVPSMLPRDKPGLQLADLSKMMSRGKSGLSAASEDKENEEECEDQTSEDQFQYLCRLYKMNYVPSGFWSRLIARLMIAVQRWGPTKDVRPTSSFRPVPHGYSMIYWREGMGVVYDGGHLLVESYSKTERNPHSRMLEDIEGVKVTVWSEEKDFSVLGFVTDQVNSLITEWYPGLEESDKHGIPLVRHVIPCPICTSHNEPTFRMRRSVSMKNVQEMEERRLPEFSLMECAAAAVDYTEIACPEHVDRPVKLSSLIPDLVLSDLPPELLIDRNVFLYNPTDENRLGSGGAGEVFLGIYKKQKVAVKRFYSSNNTSTDSGLGPSLGCYGKRSGSRHTDGGSFTDRSRVFTVSPTTIEEDLRRTKVLSSFVELRQEVSVLGRLNHPCVVALIGVCIQPMCIVLELSPLGSLFSILEKEMSKMKAERFQRGCQTAHDVRKPIFDRYLTYKIVYQVAHALHYLHELGIIYRDLKSDNLLVWSLEREAVVHVKLSDYGISRFATPQGMLGEEGTPGFQAPEVRTGSTYNEKVDIFSFAMLIYEILSGLRPFHECRCSAQIKKALRRGERPSLQQNYLDSEIPELETLMTKCWKESAVARPSAEAVLDLMEDSSFLCLNRIMPYADQQPWNSITAFIPLSEEDEVLSEAQKAIGSHSVLLWGGEVDERYYSVVDCKTGIDQVPQTLCVGPRVGCLARVGDRFWLGTEGSVIEVFGRPNPASDLKILWSIKLNSQVLGLEVEHFVDRRSVNSSIDRVRRIFACLANGSVAVISRPDFRPPFSSICSFQFKADSNEKQRREATEFSIITNIEISDPATSACCLLFVKDGRELWVGCGNMVAIVDTDTLKVVHKFRAYASPRSNVRSMVSDGPTVFTINRKTPDVFQWSVETRQRICKFNIGQEDPRGMKLAELVMPTKDNDVNASEFTDDVMGEDGDETVVKSPDESDSHDKAEGDEEGV
ncbi:leucine-rich repeat serine/threonine-protein kinase 1-like [Dendronephthya gigantea]|uniref:leucine-rich repeat serine/threonine-protein kinase 1-like n=1 Tax=Dendronephthya gigantea TaxID=151771 RepID=UPI00106D318F|nr:leucine-rich repeat serine/threonine-protein kinase 1-like [Dendronephthya gigantea]